MGNEGVTPPHLSGEEIWGPEDRRGKLDLISSQLMTGKSQGREFSELFPAPRWRLRGELSHKSEDRS